MMEMLWLGVGLAAGAALIGRWQMVAVRRVVRLERRVRGLERDLRALCAAGARAGDRLRDLEGEQRRQAAVQGRLEMRAPANGVYRQAEALAARGASIEELVTSCGIGREEAALLRLVHRRQGPAGAHAGSPSRLPSDPRSEIAFIG